MTDTRKGMLVWIASTEHSNVPAVTTLTLVGENIPEIHTPSPTAPAVEIVQHRAGPQFGEVAILVDGVDSPAAFVAKAFDGRGSRTWTMASGTWITTSDSRFPYDRPVPLHNRYEVN